MYEFTTLRIEESVNGYRAEVSSLSQELYREQAETKLEALRILERKVNDMIIEELEKLNSHGPDVKDYWEEAANG